MSSAEPRACVIIRARNEAKRLEAVLAALAQQDYAPGHKVLLVDTQSTDGTVEVARRFGIGILSLELARFSFGRALNQGSAIAQGEYLVYLSADALPLRPDYLARLLEPLADPQVAATYGRHLPRRGCGPSEARDLGEWFPAMPQGLGRPFLSNANAAVRRSVWQEHPFDEEVSGAEDILWAAEVTAAGYRIVYVPEAVVQHSHSAWPHVAYRRSRREASGLRRADPAWQSFGLWRAMRMAGGLSWLDVRFAYRHGYGPWWWPQIVLYRLAQAWGIYQGLRTG